MDITYLKCATSSEIAGLIGPPKSTTSATDITPRDYVLKFSEEGPLGIQLDIFKLDETKASQNTTTTIGALKFANAPTSAGTKVVITGKRKG